MIEITCSKCYHKFNETNGDMDERICDECFNKSLEAASKAMKDNFMAKVDQVIQWIKGGNYAS